MELNGMDEEEFMKAVGEQDVEERMQLVEAAESADWEEVKVRRPLEAVSGTECGPCEACVWGSVS